MAGVLARVLDALPSIFGGRRSVEQEPIEDSDALIEDARAAWAEYKRGESTHISSAEELDAFLDRL